MLKMKNTSFMLDDSIDERQLEVSFDGNSQKRHRGDNNNDNNDFFGLPHKVKHLFKKYKKITQLYGLYFITYFLQWLGNFLFTIVCPKL